MGCLQQTHLKCKDTNILKEKAWKIYAAIIIKIKPEWLN